MEYEEEKISRGCWQTPPDFWRVIEDIWNPIIDVCATKENSKCIRMITPEENGLTTSWYKVGTCGAAWCNPPYGKVTPWLDKAIEEMDSSVCSIVLTHATTGSQWFAKYAPLASAVWLPTPRIQFLAPPGVKQTSNNRDSQLFIFDPNVTRPPGAPTPIYSFAWKEYLRLMDERTSV